MYYDYPESNLDQLLTFRQQMENKLFAGSSRKKSVWLFVPPSTVLSRTGFETVQVRLHENGI